MRLQAAKTHWSSPGIIFLAFFSKPRDSKGCVNLVKCSLCQLIIACTKNNAHYCSLSCLQWRQGGQRHRALMASLCHLEKFCILSSAACDQRKHHWILSKNQWRGQHQRGEKHQKKPSWAIMLTHIPSTTAAAESICCPCTFLLQPSLW